MGFNYLEPYDIISTRDGEIIISEEALEIFEKNNITGYRIESIINNQESELEIHKKYFHLIGTSFMPPVPEDAIQKSESLITVKNIPSNSKFKYQKSDLKNVSDFNLSFEYLGSTDGDPYFPQRFWIVTKRLQQILITNLGQNENDFKPVILVDED
ncbi:hypothetical protein [Methanolapillus ohkumae]